MKKPSTKELDWDAYTAPLNKEVWGVLITEVIFITVMTTFVVFIRSNEFNSCFTAFFDTLLIIFGAFCGQGMKKNFQHQHENIIIVLFE